jgi:hypothetical protein
MRLVESIEKIEVVSIVWRNYDSRGLGVGMSVRDMEIPDRNRLRSDATEKNVIDYLRKRYKR